MMSEMTRRPTDDELEVMAVKILGEHLALCQMVAADPETTTSPASKAATMLLACKGQVRVKPLEWRSIGRDRVAKTMIGEYVVSLDVFQVGGTAYLWVAGQVYGDDHHSEHGNMQAAKSAAQADYEARILAALEPNPEHTDWNAAIEAAMDACTNVIKSYDVMDATGTKYLPMKTQKAAKGMVSIAREDIGKLKKGSPQ